MDILYIILAGVAGTALMYAIMWMIHRSGLANANMPRAIGSLITKNYESALLPGIAIHFLNGVVFAFGYAIFISSFPIEGNKIAATVGLAAMLSAFHGLVVSFCIVFLVAESHPLEQFRKAGIEVAVAHIAGHVAYGVGLGIVLGLTQASLVF